jgi:hypothetical protein
MSYGFEPAKGRKGEKASRLLQDRLVLLLTLEITDVSLSESLELGVRLFAVIVLLLLLLGILLGVLEEDLLEFGEEGGGGLGEGGLLGLGHGGDVEGGELRGDGGHCEGC